jgi:hypothetical protein
VVAGGSWIAEEDVVKGVWGMGVSEGMVHTNRCVYGAGSDWRACWLHSPPHTRASPVTGGAEPDRCQGRGWDRGPVSSETDY